MKPAAPFLQAEEAPFFRNTVSSVIHSLEGMQAFGWLRRQCGQTMDRKGPTRMKRSLSLFAVALALGLTAAAQSQADPTPTIGFQWLNVTPVDIPASHGWTPTTARLQPTPAAAPSSCRRPAGRSPSTRIPRPPPPTSSCPPARPPNNPDQIVAPPSGTNYSVTLEVTRDYVDSHGNAQTAVADITFNSLAHGHHGGQLHRPGHPQDDFRRRRTHQLHPRHLLHRERRRRHGPRRRRFGHDRAGRRLGHGQVRRASPPWSRTSTTPARSRSTSCPAAGAVGIQGGSTPEPSGVVLGCLGLSCLGGVFWRAGVARPPRP